MKAWINYNLGKVFYIEEFPWPKKFAPFNTYKFLYERNGTRKQISMKLNIPIVTAIQRRNK